MTRFKIVMLTLLCMLSASNAWAGWWIFGQTQDEVSTSYIYLNNTSFSELADKSIVYKEMLENGEIVIKGEAKAGKNSIGLVEVTTDGKVTWNKAILNDSGTFNYRFKPETNKTYSIYVRITDTTAQTNDVDETHKEVTVSDSRIRTLIVEILSQLINAYQAEKPTQFMAYVSDNFAGDSTNLDHAIRRDFTYFDNIRLLYTINNVVNSDGKIAVSINYNRSLTSVRNNTVYRDHGLTDFVFKIDDNKLKLFSMKNPLIFGVTDAENVATGTAANDPNLQVLSVSDQGVVTVVAFKDLGNTDNEYIDGTVTLHTYANGDSDAFIAEESGDSVERVNLNNASGYAFSVVSQPLGPYITGFMRYKMIGSMDPTQVNVSNVPTTGYSLGTVPPGYFVTTFLGEAGHTYSTIESAPNVVRIVKVMSITGAHPTYTVTLKYRFFPMSFVIN